MDGEAAAAGGRPVPSRGARILMRSGKDPFVGVGPESTLAQHLLNSNVGNQLFLLGVQRALTVDGAEVVSNGTLSETREAHPRDVARANEGFDAFVVPLANAFRPEFATRLARLTTFVEGLTIPVVVVGVGAQASLDADLDALSPIDDVVRRFVAAVLERSASIGVRGEVTADYLRRLGFPGDVVDVIGCPSLFLHGPGHRLGPARAWPGASARVALNVTPGVPGLGELCRAWVAQHPGLEFVGQDREDLALAVWGEELRPRLDPWLPTHPDHVLYREGRLGFPLDGRTWLEHLAGFDLAVGTRFHGNVAGLLAGVPALLLAHDSRTLELADYHRLPYRRVDEVEPGTKLEALHDAYTSEGFDAAYDETFDRFTAFLERNGLAHAYAGPEPATAAFDERWAAAQLPPLVRPLPAELPDEVRQRLSWLRQAVQLDARSHAGAYRHPYPHPSPPDAGSTARRRRKDVRRRIRSLERRLDAATTRTAADGERRTRQADLLARQGERLAAQRRRIAEQERRLARLERQWAEASRSPWARLTARLRRMRGGRPVERPQEDQASTRPQPRPADRPRD